MVFNNECSNHSNIIKGRYSSIGRATVPVLLTVAFVTVAERKTMASMQRRLGPNIVGYYGILQAFADALKLILKEYVSPTQANLIFSWTYYNFNIFIIRVGTYFLRFLISSMRL